MNKNHSLFAPLFTFVQHQNHSKFCTRFISRFKNHSNKIDLKKGLLQYSSSSRKKTAPQNNSNSLNCKKNQEKANNSPSYRCAAINKKIWSKHRSQFLISFRLGPSGHTGFHLAPQHGLSIYRSCNDFQTVSKAKKLFLLLFIPQKDKMKKINRYDDINQ